MISRSVVDGKDRASAPVKQIDTDAHYLFDNAERPRTFGEWKHFV